MMVRTSRFALQSFSSTANCPRSLIGAVDANANLWNHCSGSSVFVSLVYDLKNLSPSPYFLQLNFENAPNLWSEHDVVETTSQVLDDKTILVSGPCRGIQYSLSKKNELHASSFLRHWTSQTITRYTSFTHRMFCSGASSTVLPSNPFTYSNCYARPQSFTNYGLCTFSQEV